MRKLITIALFLGACADTSPTGSRCKLDSDCDTGLACDSVAVDSTGSVDICTADCDPNIPTTCPDDAVCMGVPAGRDECLALCDADGACLEGQPGQPFVGSDLCVCIPWRLSGGS